MIRSGFSDEIGHNTLLIIITCGLMLFMTLGSSEVQSWDEGLYATRARAVIEKDAWWDQSAYALGGMYSATYPPLSVWGMAVCMKSLKMSALSVRLFSVICGICSLFLMHALALYLFNRKTAMLAPPMLSACLIWNHYARQGMSDVPLMTFGLLALLAVIRVIHQTERSQKLLWSGVYALAIGAALMTKIIVSVVPLLFLSMVFMQSWLQRASPSDAARSLHSFSMTRLDLRDSRLFLLVAALLGILIALPWHISMVKNHAEFLSAFTMPHLRGVVENNARSLGPLYYVNQLLVSQPMTLFAIVWCVLVIRHRRTALYESMNSSLELLLGLWFVVGIVILSLAPTKNPHYLLLILPPALLLSMRGIELLAHYSARTRSGLLVMMSMLLTLLWTLSQSLRDEVQGLFGAHVTLLALSFVLLSMLIMCTPFVLRTERRIPVYQWLHRGLRGVIPVVLILRVALLNIWGADSSHSAAKTAKWLEDSQAHEFVYLVHGHNSSDTLAPQLSWYTKGWAGFRANNPWRTDRVYQYLQLPETHSDSTLSLLTELINVPIVYAVPSDDSLREQDIRVIARAQRTRLQTKNYIIFSRRGYSNTEVGEEAELRQTCVGQKCSVGEFSPDAQAYMHHAHATLGLRLLLEDQCAHRDE